MVFGLTRRNPYFHRDNLLPDRKKEFACSISAPPVKPTQIQNVSISNLLYIVQGNDDVYRFTVEWAPPEFSNGELEEYVIGFSDPDMMEGFFVLPIFVMVS